MSYTASEIINFGLCVGPEQDLSIPRAALIVCASCLKDICRVSNAITSGTPALRRMPFLGSVNVVPTSTACPFCGDRLDVATGGAAKYAFRLIVG